jgi:hypothetical protein
MSSGRIWYRELAGTRLPFYRYGMQSDVPCVLGQPNANNAVLSPARYIRKSARRRYDQIDLIAPNLADATLYL